MGKIKLTSITAFMILFCLVQEEQNQWFYLETSVTGDFLKNLHGDLNTHGLMPSMEIVGDLQVSSNIESGNYTGLYAISDLVLWSGFNHSYLKLFYRQDMPPDV